MNKHMNDFRFAALLAASLSALTVPAQEPTVVLKSLDGLEKRVVRMEAELGKVKKAPAAAPKPDSSAILHAAKLDSVTLRVAALEAEPKGNTKVDALGDIAALVSEVKSLTAAIKAGAEPAADAASAPDAPALRASGGNTGSTVPAVSSSASASKAAAAVAENPKAAAPTGIELKGDIQIQGERKFTSQSKRDNLDDFWGRLNFGAEYAQGGFQSKLNLRVFPEGFGFEPLTGASFDTTGQGSLKVQTQSSPRMVVNHAWVRYAAGPARIRMGRFETLETYSDNFGNYIDLGAAGKFMGRPATHNAVEADAKAGAGSVSALLGTGDRRLNRGFLRLYGRYPLLSDLQASAGWRANLFDRIRYSEEEISHRFDASLFATLPGKFKAFAEAAVLQAPGRKDDRPVLLGIQRSAGKWIDLVSAETEYLADRKAAGRLKEWFINLHARKSFGRLKIDAGCYSDAADRDWNAFSFGLRFTSNIR